MRCTQIGHVARWLIVAPRHLSHGLNVLSSTSPIGGLFVFSVDIYQY